MTKFDEYIETLERVQARRKLDEMNAILQHSLQYGSKEQTMRGLYQALGLNYAENVQEIALV